MRNIIATIAVLLSVCANAQYNETLHANITPTNKVVTGVPDWAKSDTPPVSISSNEVADIAGDIADSMAKDIVLGNYVPFIEDKNGNKTAVVIGTQPGESTYYGLIGPHSFAIGNSNLQEGENTLSVGIRNRNYGTESFVSGNRNTTLSTGSIALGGGATVSSSDNYAFAWNGVYNTLSYGLYSSHGPGTYNINPVGGLSGFYIGETNLATILSSNSGPDIDLEGFATEADLLAFYYPDGNVTSMDQITPDDGIAYAVGNDGGAYVSGGDGLTGNVVLPWKVTIEGKEYKVTAIGDSAFDREIWENNSFTSFTAPTTVKNIGDYAFFNCQSLISVSIPSATGVGAGTFSNCDLLSSVSLPSVANVDDYAFSGCDSLTSINIPYATSIGAEVFFDCSSLTSISIPSVTSIGNGAFGYCSSLTSISLPSATSIDMVAFYFCDSLASVSLPSATSIGDYVFFFCGSLTSIDFGSSPKSAVPSLGGYVFDNVPTSCKFIIPLGMYDEWIAAPGWSDLYAEGYKFEGYASIDDVKGQTPTQLSNGSEIRTADSLFRSMDNQNVLWSYVYGESVWIAVTNYMRTISGVVPSFQLWEVRDGKTNCVYWSTEEIDTRVGDKIDIAVSNVANHVATTKADRAWAKYQSMTGADNPQPNDITIVSTPSVMLSGGYEWQRFVDTGNEVWILKCNCPTMLGSSSVSNGVNTGSGYFKITDAEGKTHFSVEKTDSKLVDAVPDSVSFSNDGNGYFQVSFQSNVKPSLYVSTDLNTPFIECKEDTENDYGLTCSWSESDGIYTATIIYNPAEGKPAKLFAYGKVTQEGSVVIKNTAATSFDGGIIIGGNKYTIGTAVIDGKTVLTLENGQAVSE